MVSYQLGLRALNKVLGRDDLYSFHQVLWYEDEEDQNPPLLYLCLAQDTVLFVDVQVFDSKLDANTAAFIGIVEDEASQQRAKFPTLKLQYKDVAEVIIHSLYEDRFGLVLGDDRPDGLPAVMNLRSCYRKEVVQSLQILHNSSTTLAGNALAQLKIRFVGGNDADSQLAFRHPSIKLFEHIPGHLTEGKKVFYRRGYLFLLPHHVIDRYELLSNRPCSTYIFRPVDAASKGSSSAGAIMKPNQSKHMVVRFLPEKVVHSKDLDSELNFHLWVETIAHAVAQREFEESIPDYERNRSDDNFGDEDDEDRDPRKLPPPKYNESYFIIDQGVYRKKMNIVGDQASWTCYRLHIYTKEREIGVIGVRRRFLPPLLDTYQDMVFVLYGAEKEVLIEEPDFMKSLESAVDSLSPASTALQSRVGSTRQMHPTYYDGVVLQARANALFYNRDMYAWLKQRGGIGVIPRTKFIDLECNRLATIFCYSITKKFVPENPDSKWNENADPYIDGNALEMGAEEDGDTPLQGGDGDEEVTVDNPLSIIFRMQSAKAIVGKDGDSNVDADGDGVDDEENALSSGWDPALEDWKHRISLYFAYCVDGGQDPQRLTISELAKQSVRIFEQLRARKDGPHKEALKDNLKVLDRVMDFLLFMKPGGEKAFRGRNNLVQKFRLCQENGKDFREGFILNEWVMVRILETDYLEMLMLRHNAEIGSDKDKVDFVLLTYLYKALLTRTDNLELIQAVTNKISSVAKPEERSTGLGQKKKKKDDKSGRLDRESIKLDGADMLVEPLVELMRVGNVMLKTLSIRCLTALVAAGGLKDEHSSTFSDDNPVLLAMAIVRDSKSPLLLQGALNFLKVSFPFLEKQKANPLALDPMFRDILLNFLDERLGTKKRLHPRILGDTAMLMLHLSRSKESLRDYFIRADVVSKLMAIIKDYNNYAFILAELTGALTLILTLDQRLRRPSSDRSTLSDENAKEHAVILVEVLGFSSTSDTLKVSNNILTALDTILDIGNAQGNHDDEERRFNILKHLATTHQFDFDSIMDAVMKKADDMITTAEEDKTKNAHRADARKQRNKRTAQIANKLIRKFKGLIRQAKKAEWRFHKYEYDGADAEYDSE